MKANTARLNLFSLVLVLAVAVSGCASIGFDSPRAEPGTPKASSNPASKAGVPAQDLRPEDIEVDPTSQSGRKGG